MTVKLVAVAGLRWEPEWLLADMAVNLEPFVEGVAVVDCRPPGAAPLVGYSAVVRHPMAPADPWLHEGDYRVLQRAALEEAGATHALVTSPDERWDFTARQIRQACGELGRAKFVLQFPLRELWTATQYRADGIWGRKTRRRVFPLLAGQTMTRRRLQSSPVPIDAGYRTVPLPDVLLWHLKMIEPGNRVTRAAAYEKADPGYKLIPRRAERFARLDADHGGRFGRLGYHYLADEEGIELREIPPGHGYAPAYRPFTLDVPWLATQ